MFAAELLLILATVGQRGGRWQAPPQRPAAVAPAPAAVQGPQASKKPPQVPPVAKTSGAPGLPQPGLHEFVDAANDRAKAPPELQQFLFYFTTACCHPEEKVMVENSLQFITASCCYKTDLEFYQPKQITDTLWRIDINALGWNKVWHPMIVKWYPYYWQYDVNRHHYSPLVIRADWFCADGYDQKRTGDMHLQFLYAGAPPKTLSDFYKFWGVSVADREFVFGLMAGESGVAIGNNGQPATRLIENFPSSRRGYAWSTRDARRVAGHTDPLETLPDKMVFDAREHIYGMYKVRRGKSGLLNAYLLTDKQDRVAAEGPTDIVVAKAPADVRGVAICNSATCVYCHSNGIIPPTVDEYRLYITDPTRLFQDYKSKYITERFYGSDLAKEIAHNQELYSDGIAIVNGLTAGANARHYAITVQRYIQKVDCEQLARELAVLYGDRITEQELRLALGYASSRGYLSGRSAWIAEGHPMTRDQVVENFYLFQEVLDLWYARPAK